MIASDVRTQIYQPGEAITHHGDAATALWLVVSGWVKLTRQTPDGKESIIGLCTDGDVFGEAALFPCANYPYHAEVIGTEAELIAIPADIIRGLIARNTALAASIMFLLNERVAQAQLKLEHLNTLTAAQRLGCFFLRLCHNRTEGEITLKIPIEKHVLATYLGMKPETLSRAQQQLKPLGISVAGPAITIGNIVALRRFVCESCSESGNCDIEKFAG